MARFRIDSTDSDCNVSAERWRNSRVEEDSSLEGCWFRELNRRFAIPVAFPSICAAAGLTMSENRLTDVVRVLFLGRNRESGRLALFGLNRLPRALAAIRGVVGVCGADGVSLRALSIREVVGSGSFSGNNESGERNTSAVSNTSKFGSCAVRPGTWAPFGPTKLGMKDCGNSVE